ncbi:MAG: DUF308 domain-containing protein [Clostridia bacterium]|nr:DUF308 domain-containing protein [Clostridia bacterium]
MNMVRYAKTGSILSGITFIACGLFISFFPSASILTVCYAVGAVIIISGIVKIVGYFSKDLYSLAFQFDLALGIFSILLGAALILRPKLLVSVFPVIIGLILLVNSLFTFQTSMDSKRFGLDYWWVSLIISIITSVLGILIIVNPFSSAKVIMTLIGIMTFFAGAEKIFLSLYTVVISKQKAKKESYIDVTDYEYKKPGDEK